MGRYITTHGQNLYDVALHIYGSIEGIVDLMMNNTTLSLNDNLKAGTELLYTDNFIINSDTAYYLKNNKITPANGEQNIYFKASQKPKILEIYTGNRETSVGLSISGSGIIEVDWGDNTDIQTIVLSETFANVIHTFDNSILGKRKIIIYGDGIEIKKIDFSKLKATEIYLLRPIYMERLIIQENTLSVDFISLVDGVFDMDLSFVTTGSLLPLLKCKQLMKLVLSGANIRQTTIDDYLIHLVKQYHERRNCSIVLTTEPSGTFQEPKRDSDNNYIITSGMEAIWVLTHEIAWNEYGSWEFIIKDRLYTYVKPGSEYIQITPEKLDWKNPEIGKEQSMRVQSNKDWRFTNIQFQELL